jgi:hypothetical protein
MFYSPFIILNHLLIRQVRQRFKPQCGHPTLRHLLILRQFSHFVFIFFTFYCEGALESEEWDISFSIQTRFSPERVETLVSFKI